MSLVSTDWLEKNLNKVKILDASWHMPNTKRNGYEEYKKDHIKNSIFFDIDKFSNKKTNLPHMLPDSSEWEKIVSSLGISNDEAYRRALEVVNDVKLPDSERILKSFPHQLSGGQQQRIVIAMALMSKPSLLIFLNQFYWSSDICIFPVLVRFIWYTGFL